MSSVSVSSVGECRFAFARDPAQHGVDQAGIARGVLLALHQTHRQIDRGVIGHIEKEDLRGAEQQGRVRRARFPAAADVSASRRRCPSACRAGAARSPPACAPARGRDLRAPAAPAECCSSSSSKARLRRSTPSRMSAAICRAGRPGTGAGSGRGLSHAPSASHEATAEASLSAAMRVDVQPHGPLRCPPAEPRLPRDHGPAAGVSPA